MNERAIRPNDVPGRLLNMSLLNVGSDDPGLRLAAYNLLYALSLTFRFDVGNQLLNARGNIHYLYYKKRERVKCMKARLLMCIYLISFFFYSCLFG